MDVLLFHNTITEIDELAARDGPNTNVLEPKSDACHMLEQVCNSLNSTYEQARAVAEHDQNAITETHTSLIRVQQQLCQARSLLARIQCELGDYVAALDQLKMAHTLLELSENGKSADGTSVSQCTEFSLFITQQTSHFLRKDRGYEGCVAFMSVYNASGIYLSTISAGEARHALSLAERLYMDWDAWFMKQPDACSITDVPIDSHGKVQFDPEMLGCMETESDTSESSKRIFMRLTRFEMDKAFTSTLFFLAQVCTSLQDAEAASIYCHRTLYSQLLCRQECDKKRWATNALQISEYYCSVHAYGKALHCLEAGRDMMTKATTPSVEDGGEEGNGCAADDEETTGLVARSYGRYYLSYLTYYAMEGRQKHQQQQQQQQQHEPSLSTTHSDICVTFCASSASETSAEDAAKSALNWWKDFPGIGAMREQPAILTLQNAHDVYKSGLKWLKRALAYHAFENSCTQHIHITQEISNLHATLCWYERRRGRVIALKQRQVNLLKSFPDQLNFNAYPTLIRQLLYDIGSVQEDLITLRHEQISHPFDGEVALSPTAFNDLVRSTVAVYEKFCRTWLVPSTQCMPDELSEPDDRLPFFRVLVRLVMVTMRYVCSTPQESLDNMERLTALTKRVIDFGERNTFCKEQHTEVQQSMSQCRELASRIPLNQYMLRNASRQ